jgi:competence protein ComEC
MKRRMLGLWLLALAALSGMFFGCAPSGMDARILFIDVGKGDAALILHGEKRYLIDTGPEKAYGSVAAALSHYGVDALDAVFLTHSDKDHAGGLNALAKSGIYVGAWYASVHYTLDEDASAHPIEQAAAQRGQAPVYLSAGEKAGPFTVLAPIERDKNDDDNNSLVLMFESSAGRALLTGDMKFAQEEDLLKSQQDLSCDVIKIAHHGNSDATSEALMDRAKPKLAVVSTDSDERPELPDRRVTDLLNARGIPLYTTWRSGGGILVTLANDQATAAAVQFGGGP